MHQNTRIAIRPQAEPTIVWVATVSELLKIFNPNAIRNRAILTSVVSKQVQKVKRKVAYPQRRSAYGRLYKRARPSRPYL